MLLRSMHIRHFKSLDDVRVDFAGPLTVIVGPNAVGKSNVVDCLRFIRDAVTTSLEHAISLRGGMGRIRQHTRTKPYQVTFGLAFEEGSKQARYELTLVTGTAGNYSIESERALGAAIKARYAVSVGGGEVSVQESDTGFQRDSAGRVLLTHGSRSVDQRLRADQLAIGTLPSLFALGGPVAEFIRDWRYCAIFPSTLKTPASPDKDSVLAEDGGNWASVIKALKRTARGRAAMERINEAMRSVLPSYRDVSVTTVGSYLVPKFRFSSGPNEVEFDPVQLSDGTLRIFGMLLALQQSPPPQLLVIEEPEQTVHPGVLSVLAEAMREASEVTQIIVTTHSPHFVDQFEPEQIRVVTLDSGMTRVAPIKSTQVEAIKQRLMGLGEFMLAEGLQAQEP